MNTLEFLKSINDGKHHEFKNSDPRSVFDGTNEEYNFVLSLKQQGLVNYTGAMKHGRPVLSSYWITDKGKQYIKDHSKFKPFKKLF